MLEPSLTSSLLSEALDALAWMCRTSRAAMVITSLECKFSLWSSGNHPDSWRHLPREDQTHHTALEVISTWPQVHVVLLFERGPVVAFFVRSLLCVKLLDVVGEVVVGLPSDEPVREGGSVPDVAAVRELKHRAFPLVDRPSKAETELATEFHRCASWTANWFFREALEAVKTVG